MRHVWRGKDFNSFFKLLIQRHALVLAYAILGPMNNEIERTSVEIG